MPRTKEGHLYTVHNNTHTTGLHTDAVIPSTPTIHPSYDVIIIGAGFAGLIAARDLARSKDLSVLLLEGRDRIGGRTWTAQALSEEFEMGGTWIHWNQPHVFAEACRYGLQSSLKTSSGTAEMVEMWYKPKGKAIKRLDVGETNEKLERLAAEFFTVEGMTARGLMPWPHETFREPVQGWRRYDHLSVRDRLDQMEWSEEDKDLLEAHFNSLGSGTGKDTAFTSALHWYALAGYNMQALYAAVGTFKFGKGGMTNFARSILAEYKGDRLMSTKVKAIRQSDRSVTVCCVGGRDIATKRVVCTVPLNCLTDIVFDPPLSTLRKKAISKPHMNVGAKIHYSIKETQPAWFANTADAAGSDLLFAFSDHNGTQKDNRPGTFAIGFGYNGRLQDPAQHEVVIAAFKKFKPDATVRAFLTHPWDSDEFSKGTWYCASPNMSTKFQQELQTSHDRVHMASADWADVWRGFVDGAIEQGSRAAIAVAKARENDSRAAKARL